MAIRFCFETHGYTKTGSYNNVPGDTGEVFLSNLLKILKKNPNTEEQFAVVALEAMRGFIRDLGRFQQFKKLFCESLQHYPLKEVMYLLNTAQEVGAKEEITSLLLGRMSDTSQ
jgi:hypothetical protein